MVPTSALTPLIEAFADAAGTKIGLLRNATDGLAANVGTLTQLTTAETGTLVAAVNSLAALVRQVPTQIGAMIADGTVAHDTTWSSARIAPEIASRADAAAQVAVAALDAGRVQAAMDAIVVLQGLLTSDVNFRAALQAIQTKSLQVNIDQTVTANGVPGFTAAEQERGRLNLNAAKADDVADLAASVGVIIGANFANRMRAAASPRIYARADLSEVTALLASAPHLAASGASAAIGVSGAASRQAAAGVIANAALAASPTVSFGYPAGPWPTGVYPGNY